LRLFPLAGGLLQVCQVRGDCDHVDRGQAGPSRDFSLLCPAQEGIYGPGGYPIGSSAGRRQGTGS
jgi:hypothetical protein